MSLYSERIPGLQMAWDATSLRALMFCPRSYELGIKRGYRSPGNVDTRFGGLAAEGFEAFKKARSAGEDKESATKYALAVLLERTWDEELDQPWGGRYEMQWRCKGDTPYKNKAGNKAKCPYSHAGQWFPEPAPDMCGHCGGATEQERRWVSDDPYKNRHTLIRLLCWWCDEQVENGGVEVYTFPSGQPAVEYSFLFPLPIYNSQGERFLLCGHLDSIDHFGGEVFISDNKTTKKVLNGQYWSQYSPNVQVDTYDFAGSVLFPDLGVRGVRIDAAQTLVGGARFGAQVFYRNEPQREEYLRDVTYWLGQAEHFATEGYYPMNRANCAMCQFKHVCKHEPGKREMYLTNGDYVQHKWNPLEER